ncbi:hypothetical protein B0H11DRAFT_2233965 [Mycena galericulata]|nr:hypothetical protein B0H11DRAFT_2233965 [Mycena galericulata]
MLSRHLRAVAALVPVARPAVTVTCLRIVSSSLRPRLAHASGVPRNLLFSCASAPSYTNNLPGYTLAPSVAVPLFVSSREALSMSDTQLAPETLVAVLMVSVAVFWGNASPSPPSFSLTLPLPLARGPFAGAGLSAGAGPFIHFYLFLSSNFSLLLKHSQQHWQPRRLLRSPTSWSFRSTGLTVLP